MPEVCPLETGGSLGWCLIQAPKIKGKREREKLLQGEQTIPAVIKGPPGTSIEILAMGDKLDQRKVSAALFLGLGFPSYCQDLWIQKLHFPNVGSGRASPGK